MSVRESKKRNGKLLRPVAFVVMAVMLAACVLSACSQDNSGSTEPSAVAVETVAPAAVSQEPAGGAVQTMEPSADTAATAQVMLPEMQELYAQNSDIVGWIQIEGTKIDYPVMYTPEDGQFYLYRTFEKQEDPTQEGCVFVDEFCSVDPRSTNLLIHGHNMKNGTMFHTLIDYKEEDFYKEHPTIKFKTLYDEEEYEIAYAFLSKVYNYDDTDWKFYKFYTANNEEEYNDFLDHCEELQLYDTGVRPQFGDDLITLTTCEYSTDNGRMVVVARKVTPESPLQGDAAKVVASANQTTVEGQIS